MSCDIGEATEGLENELYLCHSSFSKLSVTSPTSQLILQPFRTSPTSQLILLPFRRFTYITAHSPTLLLLHLLHSSFSNPSFASLTSQVLHLIHLASHPWFFHAPCNQCNLLFIFCFFFSRETIKFDRNN